MMKAKQTKLREKWQPSERCYEYLEARNHGMTREWLGHQIPGFKLYYLGAGNTQASWDCTFDRWVSKNWETVDKRRMYMEKTQPDLPTQNPPKVNFKPTIASNLPEPPKELTKEQRIATADMLAGLSK